MCADWDLKLLPGVIYNMLHIFLPGHKKWSVLRSKSPDPLISPMLIGNLLYALAVISLGLVSSWHVIQVCCLYWSRIQGVMIPFKSIHGMALVYLLQSFLFPVHTYSRRNSISLFQFRSLEASVKRHCIFIRSGKRPILNTHIVLIFFTCSFKDQSLNGHDEP